MRFLQSPMQGDVYEADKCNLGAKTGNDFESVNINLRGEVILGDSYAKDRVAFSYVTVMI